MVSLAPVRRFLPILGPVLLVAAAVAIAAAGPEDEGRIGPENRIQPSGRKLSPAGDLTRLGNHPAGGGLTLGGRFAWTLSAGRGANDVRVVRVLPRASCRGKRRAALRRCRRVQRRQVGRVIQRIKMPGLTGGVAFDPRRPVAYVSGVAEGDSYTGSTDVPASTPGREGDVIHVLRYNRRTGRVRRSGVIEVPPPAGTQPPQNFPPTNTRVLAWPRDIAVSPDGSTLLVALNLAHSAAVVDTASREVSYVPTGRYPYGAAILRGGRTGLVSNEADGTVSVIDLEAATERKEIRVGPHLSHPEGIAVDPKSGRAFVAVTHQDLVAVIDPRRLEVERTLSVERPQGIGTAPTHVSVTRDGCRLLVSNSGEDAVAVFALATRAACEPARRSRRRLSERSRQAAERALEAAARQGIGLAESERAERAEVFGEEAEEEVERELKSHPIQRRGRKWQLLGRVPVASYPVAAFATPQRPAARRLVWITAKGLGVGSNEALPGQEIPADPGSATGNAPERFRFRYLPENVKGMSGVMRFPGTRALARLTPRAARQIRPVNGQKPPPGTPLRADGPIDHVFYIVRENRTYDQILGDLARGDGDRKLTLFGARITPNAHALARRFGILDHVYANSEASIDGHFWTSAGSVSDYVVKNWHQNYAGRGRPYDFGVYAVTWPSQGFLFDQAQKQGISWFNYGEAIAGTVPFPDQDRTPEENAQVVAKFSKSDLGPLAPGPQVDPPAPCFSNDASSGGENVITGQEVFDSSRPAGANPLTTESRFECFKERFEQQLAGDSVPAFSYVTLPNDHTSGTTPGARTPRAMIAENDLALGEIVDLISHSPIWRSSLILVIEDDSQDGLDHVDAHRIPALAISPYSRRAAVVHTRYDFLSFIRTLERVVGMRPLNLFDALAVPLYDAFDANPSDNDEPYQAIVPDVDLLERNTASSPAARLSQKLPLDFTDRAPQRLLDRILWKYVHGAGSEPPPPGPNASGLDEDRWWRESAPSRAELLADVRELLGVSREQQDAAFGGGGDD